MLYGMSCTRHWFVLHTTPPCMNVSTVLSRKPRRATTKPNKIKCNKKHDKKTRKRRIVARLTVPRDCQPEQSERIRAGTQTQTTVNRKVRYGTLVAQGRLTTRKNRMDHFLRLLGNSRHKERKEPTRHAQPAKKLYGAKQSARMETG